MCGLFGFTGEQLDIALLQRAAGEAGRRGPHAYGFASEAGIVRALGCMSDNLRALSQCRGTWVVGSARLATFGGYRKTEDNQPLVTEGAVLSHNGNVYEYRRILAELNYIPATEMDSEALLAAIVQRQDWPALLEDLGKKTPQAALVYRDGSYYTARYGHPLYALPVGAGTYYGSRPFDERCRLVPEGVKKVGA